MCWQWPGPLNNNELFDLPWNSSVCVIIFLSDAYSLTWLLWLQSALFVCMFDDEWAVNTFVLRGSLSSEAGRVQVGWIFSNWCDVLWLHDCHCQGFWSDRADKLAAGFIYHAPPSVSGKWKQICFHWSSQVIKKLTTMHIKRWKCMLLPWLHWLDSLCIMLQHKRFFKARRSNIQISLTPQ